MFFIGRLGFLGLFAFLFTFQGAFAQNQAKFPLLHPAMNNYQEGPASFGYITSHGNGRFHSSVRLHARSEEKIHAMLGGEVLRTYPFTVLASKDRPQGENTYAVEVKQDDGFIVRYQFLTDTKLQAGDRVEQMDAIGTVFTPFNKYTSAYAAIEMYDGSETGPLTVRQSRTLRRGDLIDPTEYLLEAQKRSFPLLTP